MVVLTALSSYLRASISYSVMVNSSSCFSIALDKGLLLSTPSTSFRTHYNTALCVTRVDPIVDNGIVIGWLLSIFNNRSTAKLSTLEVETFNLMNLN